LIDVKGHGGVAWRVALALSDECWHPGNQTPGHILFQPACAGLRNKYMNAQELADKFTAKIAVAAVEKDRQSEIAVDNVGKRTADVEHCKRAMEQKCAPFLGGTEARWVKISSLSRRKIDLNDHRPVGVSFKIGDGAPTTITTAFGNMVVTRICDSGTCKGIPFVYAPDVEPYILNSGDLTRDKIAKLVEMVIDTAS
jgi:hypothetical protein